MAIAFRNSSGAYTAQSSATSGATVSRTITPALPTGWQPGDLAIFRIGKTGINELAFTPPSGWTQISSDSFSVYPTTPTPNGFFSTAGVTEQQFMVCYRRLQAGDTAPSVTFNLKNISGKREIAIADIECWSGVIATGVPYEGLQNVQTPYYSCTTGTAPIMPAGPGVTTLGPGRVVLTYDWTDRDFNFDLATGNVERFDWTFGLNSFWCSTRTSERFAPANGTYATSTRVASFTGASNQDMGTRFVAFALIPASAVAFNPADANSNIVLSNGNLTATDNTGVGGGVRTTLGVTPVVGLKKGVEFTVNSVYTGDYSFTEIGVVDSGFALGGGFWPGLGGTSNWGMDFASNLATGGGVTGGTNQGNLTAGSVVRLLFEVTQVTPSTTFKVWASKNGAAWNGVATDTQVAGGNGAQTVSGLNGGPFYIEQYFEGGGPGSVTYNFGTPSIAYPTGFSQLDPIPVIGPLAATDAYTDTASIAMNTPAGGGVSAALAATDAYTDTASIAATVTVNAALAATDAYTDTCAIAAQVKVSGAMRVMEPNVTSDILLLSFDGVDGDTSPVYDDTRGAMGTFTNLAQLKTATKKFGTASAAFNGASSTCYFADDPIWDLNAGDFTIELFANHSVKNNAQAYLGHWDTNSFITASAWFLYIESGQLKFRSCTGSTLVDVVFTWSPTLGQWYHIAVDRSGNTCRLYIDGVCVATNSAFNHTINTCAAPLSIGTISYPDTAPTYAFNGFMDEVRISKGVARYASGAGFTPPTAPHARPASPDTTAAAVSITTGGNTVTLNATDAYTDTASIAMNTPITAPPVNLALAATDAYTDTTAGAVTVVQPITVALAATDSYVDVASIGIEHVQLSGTLAVTEDTSDTMTLKVSVLWTSPDRVDEAWVNPQSSSTVWVEQPPATATLGA
jgi:hypothetical protein